MADSSSSTCAPARAAGDTIASIAASPRPTSRASAIPVRGARSNILIAKRLGMPAAQVRHTLRQRYRARGAFASALILHIALLESALPDRDPVWNADQLEIREHDAGSLAAIVEQHLYPRGFEFVVEAIGCG